MDQPSPYPHTYGYGWGWGTGTCLTGLAFAGFGVWLAVWGYQLLDQAPLWLLGGLGSVFAAIGLYTTLSVFRSYLRLEDDGLTAGFVFRKYAVKRDQIVGIRNIKKSFGTTGFDLIFKDTKEQSITLTDFARQDQAFLEWFGEFIDLDEQDEIDEGQRILDNPAFGADEETRQKTALNEEMWVGRLNLVGVAVCIWGWIYPHPYIYCVMALAILPPMVVIMVFFKRKRWMLHDFKDTGRMSLGVLAFMPVCALSVRAILDVNMLDWQWPLGIAIGLSVIGYFTATWIEGVFKPLQFLLFGFAYVAYFWGILIFGNWYFDEAKPIIYPVTVLDKSSGSHSNDLKVTAWGPDHKPEDVSVDAATFKAFKRGDEACVYLFSGALGWRWYYADTCETSKP